jgi:putrescine transport system permease protein
VTLGLAFLYMPILLLVIYSFNESRLVTVWGGFSTRWYVSLQQSELLDAAWVTCGSRSVGDRRHRARHARRRGAGALSGASAAARLFSGMVYAPLVMPEVITGLSLLLLFVAIDFARGFWTVTIAHTTF